MPLQCNADLELTLEEAEERSAARTRVWGQVVLHLEDGLGKNVPERYFQQLARLLIAEAVRRYDEPPRLLPPAEPEP